MPAPNPPQSVISVSSEIKAENEMYVAITLYLIVVFLPFSSQQILPIPGRKMQRASTQTNIDLKKERQDSTNLQQIRSGLNEFHIKIYSIFLPYI